MLYIMQLQNQLVVQKPQVCGVGAAVKFCRCQVNSATAKLPRLCSYKRKGKVLLQSAHLQLEICVCLDLPAYDFAATALQLWQ